MGGAQRLDDPNFAWHWLKMMRTARDFDEYYRTPDPWAIAAATRRDRALSKVVKPYVEGKRVLELGCGEGHLTAALLDQARSVVGIYDDATKQ